MVKNSSKNSDPQSVLMNEVVYEASYIKKSQDAWKRWMNTGTHLGCMFGTIGRLCYWLR